MAFFRKEKEILRNRGKDGFYFILQVILLIMSMLFRNSVFLECHVAPLFPGIKCRRSAVSGCRNCGIDAICIVFIADASAKSEFSEGMPAASELIERKTAVFPQLRPGGDDRMEQKKNAPV